MEAPNGSDFRSVAIGAIGGVGVAPVAWPLIDEMNPERATHGLASTEIIGAISNDRPATFAPRLLAFLMGLADAIQRCKP
jgi:hypothetical protein